MPQYSSCNSKTIASSGVVTTAGNSGYLYGWLLSGGTTASSLTLRNGGGSGTIVVSDSIKAQTAAGDATSVTILPLPIFFSTDIYASIAGTNASAFVFYVESQH